MMAVPRALSLLGLLPGLTLMTLMAGLTYWTLSQLVAASETAGARDSYGGLVRRTVGRGAERVLQVCICICTFGVHMPVCVCKCVCV
jgi:amino acid permease